MTTVLYTIGNRDVQVNGDQDENERLRSATREAGEAGLLQWREAARRKDQAELDRLRARYRITQLNATVDRIATREGVIGRLCLFVTDQPEGVDFRRTDSLHAGELAAELLRTDPARKRLLKQVKVEPLKRKGVGIDPADYGQCFDLLREKLPALKIPDGGRVYLCPTSGTPAMTMGLILAGLLTAGARCHLLYLGQGDGSPRKGDFPFQFLRALRRRDLQAALTRYDYDAAAALMRDAGDQPWLVAVAEAAAARLNFDFSRAWRCLEDAAIPGNAAKAFARFSAAAERLAVPEAPITAKLAELATQLPLLWSTGRYLDFTGRAILFLENAAGLVVDRGLGLSGDGPRGPRLATLLEGPEQRPALMRFIERQRLQAPSLADKAGHLSTFFMVRLLSFIISDENDALSTLSETETIAIREVVPQLQELDVLRDMRNTGTHFFGGVGSEQIAAAYGDGIETLPDRLLECARSLTVLEPSAGGQIPDGIPDWPSRLNESLLKQFDAQER